MDPANVPISSREANQKMAVYFPADYFLLSNELFPCGKRREQRAVVEII